MVYLSILLGLFVGCLLCVFGFIIYSKWVSFRDLKQGDTCYIASNANILDTPLISEEITKVEIGTSGQTRKIYMKDKSYNFFNFLKNNVRVADDF